LNPSTISDFEDVFDVSRKSPFFVVFWDSGSCYDLEVMIVMVEKKIKCPQCGCERVYKDGIRYTTSGEVQRYLCRNCGYRFSC
jgi:predicted RNA-binding Zn-ribbon protein involved in translation (DUF1610 family)